MENEIGISLRALSERCTTVYGYTFYFDDGCILLYDRAGNLCCMDGETVSIVDHTAGTYTLRNDYDANPVYFRMTDEELRLCTFNPDFRKI